MNSKTQPAPAADALREARKRLTEALTYGGNYWAELTNAPDFPDVLRLVLNSANAHATVDGGRLHDPAAVQIAPAAEGVREKIALRLMEQADITSLHEIISLNYSVEYADRAVPEMREMFASGPSKPVYVVAEQQTRIVGVAAYIQSWTDWSVYNIFWVNVHPDRQRQGIGRRLVDNIISRIRKYEDAKLILLTAKAPEYYSPFGFLPLLQFSGDISENVQLMGLRLEEALPSRDRCRGEAILFGAASQC